MCINVLTSNPRNQWSERKVASSPSTILRCLNRVALSFLTSWIFSVDFLTSTCSFLLNMVQCEPPPAATTRTIIDGVQSGPHGYGPTNYALSACQGPEMHSPFYHGLASNFASAHTSDQMYVAAILTSSPRTAHNLSGQWHHRPYS